MSEEYGDGTNRGQLGGEQGTHESKHQGGVDDGAAILIFNDHAAENAFMQELLIIGKDFFPFPLKFFRANFFFRDTYHLDALLLFFK